VLLVASTHKKTHGDEGASLGSGGKNVGGSVTRTDVDFVSTPISIVRSLRLFDQHK
jgi:hypothetical protein